LGGVKLPLALAELGLIDEYEFVVQPRLVGHGPTLFAGLSQRVDLKLVSQLEFGSGRWRCGMSREGSHRARAAVGLGLVFLPLVVALLATVSRASIVLVGLSHPSTWRPPRRLAPAARKLHFRKARRGILRTALTSTDLSLP